ncbi:MAG: META domain-containing protein [Pseudomonadota bacterium]
MTSAPLRALFIVVVLSAVANTTMMKRATAQKPFPYDAELRLDAAPMKGSKRLPWLQFSANGTVDIDLWCASGHGRAVIVDKSITITPTALRDNQCTQAQLEADKDFLAKLMQVTAWRWEGVLLVLEGPQALRWRPVSN